MEGTPNVPQAHRYELTLAGRPLVLETGKYAKQASGSVLVRYADTVVLATAQASETPVEADFLPLTVEFEERHYAVGKIPGSFMRREGRPGEKAILSARMTDRPIRPLFPKGFRHEVQIIVTVLSADQKNPPDILGPIAASAALMLSDIPWEGPIAAVRVGLIGGSFVLNPTLQELEESQLDLVVAGSKEAILMVEAEAGEVDEETLVQALEFAHKEMQPILELQEAMARELAKPKMAWTPRKASPRRRRRPSTAWPWSGGFPRSCRRRARGKGAGPLRSSPNASSPRPSPRGRTAPRTRARSPSTRAPLTRWCAGSSGGSSSRRASGRTAAGPRTSGPSGLRWTSCPGPTAPPSSPGAKPRSWAPSPWARAGTSRSWTTWA